MFDLYIMYIFGSAKVSHTSLKECRLGKPSLVRDTDLNLINHYVLYKEKYYFI